MGQLVVLYNWPVSQLCLGCAHRLDMILEESAALCGIAEGGSDGIDCPSFESENPEENDEDVE